MLLFVVQCATRQDVHSELTWPFALGFTTLVAVAILLCITIAMKCGE